MKLPRKWIDQEIERMDPVTDYEVIWKLSSVYRINDFQLNMVYAITFPHFYLGTHAAAALVRGGQGKIIKQQDKRVADTNRHMLTWWEKGPHHPDTQRSVAAINKLHAHYAQTWPEAYDLTGDYVYTLCYEGCGFHRLAQRVGLRGYTDKQKLASYRFWTEMSKLFRVATDGRPLDGWPADFDGMMAVMDEFEGRPWQPYPDGIAATEAVLEQWQNKFPRPLRKLARTFIVSMYGDHIIRAYQVRPPSPLTRAVMRKVFAAMVFMGERVAPDPRISFPEKQRQQALRASADQPMADSHSGPARP